MSKLNNTPFNIENYEPKGWDVIRTEKDGIFIITNNMLFGPTAYVLHGPTVDNTNTYMKYQETTLKKLVMKINIEYPITTVERGFKGLVRAFFRVI
ncbi:hypothetical protein QNH36_03065 [Mesobacillus sp. AQ2]|uniref:hypothetical protein n=1 Tax=Mesobacillus sp. AQ2 TaxID=3043332 RepID=UPI0024C1931F|nr:hypothetical protein [Mesobacillus sp. AQ2]WHX41162.1 hypothetical protein QNH36_03065 [Mesobacillus sp. AQ2]